MDIADIKNRMQSEDMFVDDRHVNWLIAEVERLTALCDEYRGERDEWQEEAKRFLKGRDDALSALTRARAEGMEDAVKVVESVRFWNLASRKEVTDAIRAEACRLAEQANKGEKS